jgi:hypothetical protein
MSRGFIIFLLVLAAAGFVTHMARQGGSSGSRASRGDGTSSGPGGIRILDLTPGPPTLTDVRREQLLGGWWANDNTEYLQLASNGDMRSAISVRYKITQDDMIIGCSASGVLTGKWTLDRGQIRFKDVVIGKVMIRHVSVVPLNMPDVDINSLNLARVAVRDEAQVLFKQEFEKFLREERVGGNVTKITANEFSMKHTNPEASHYRRADQKTTVDPDGTNARVFTEKDIK